MLSYTVPVRLRHNCGTPPYGPHIGHSPSEGMGFGALAPLAKSIGRWRAELKRVYLGHPMLQAPTGSTASDATSNDVSTSTALGEPSRARPGKVAPSARAPDLSRSRTNLSPGRLEPGKVTTGTPPTDAHMWERLLVRREPCRGRWSNPSRSLCFRRMRTLVRRAKVAWMHSIRAGMQAKPWLEPKSLRMATVIDALFRRHSAREETAKPVD